MAIENGDGWGSTRPGTHHQVEGVVVVDISQGDIDLTLEAWESLKAQPLDILGDVQQFHMGIAAHAGTHRHIAIGGERV